MISALVLLFAQDAYWICQADTGQPPKQECLRWVTECLEDGRRQGYSEENNREYCAEAVPPELIGWSFL